MAKRGTRSTTSKSSQTSKTKNNKSASRGGTKAATKTTLTYEQIAMRAEHIWRQQGCPAGQDEQNWHEAERQLKNELGLQ